MRARRQDMIEEMAIKARQMEDQNMQLANHASAVEQQHAAMLAQLGDFNQRLQQTTVDNEQLAKEIFSLRNAVNVSPHLMALGVHPCVFAAAVLASYTGCCSLLIWSPESSSPQNLKSAVANAVVHHACPAAKGGCC